jgi:hypothetical protein
VTPDPDTMRKLAVVLGQADQLQATAVTALRDTDLETFRAMCHLIDDMTPEALAGLCETQSEWVQAYISFARLGFIGVLQAYYGSFSEP